MVSCIYMLIHECWLDESSKGAVVMESANRWRKTTEAAHAKDEHPACYYLFLLCMINICDKYKMHVLMNWLGQRGA